MLDIVIGQRENDYAVEALVQSVREMELTGTLYVGYPVFPSVDAPITIDAMLTTREHAVVVFDFIGEDPELSLGEVEKRQDALYASVFQENSSATSGSEHDEVLAVNIEVVSLAAISTTQAPEASRGKQADHHDNGPARTGIAGSSGSFRGSS